MPDFTDNIYSRLEVPDFVSPKFKIKEWMSQICEEYVMTVSIKGGKPVDVKIVFKKII